MAQTVYANVVNVKLSAQEMILEFGAIFPDALPVPGTLVAFEPEVRVVMTISGLKPTADAFQTALKALEHARSAIAQSNPGQTASK